MSQGEPRVAVVTGGAQGIGKAVSERLAEAGNIPVIWDINQETADEAVDVLEDAGHEAAGMAVDVSDHESVREATERTVEEFGHIDVLVNNAGIGGSSKLLWEVPVDEWEQVLDVNLNGVFYCCKEIVPLMREQGWGRIVNMSSIAGKEGNPMSSPYSTSKSGVIGLTKSLGKELSEDGILVNCVTPALIDTPIIQQVSEEHRQYMIEKIPMNRLGQPEEVAELVYWLASDACSFSTGAVFDISGGRATY